MRAAAVVMLMPLLYLCLSLWLLLRSKDSCSCCGVCVCCRCCPGSLNKNPPAPTQRSKPKALRPKACSPLTLVAAPLEPYPLSPNRRRWVRSISAIHGRIIRAPLQGLGGLAQLSFQTLNPKPCVFGFVCFSAWCSAEGSCYRSDAKS